MRLKNAANTPVCIGVFLPKQVDLFKMAKHPSVKNANSEVKQHIIQTFLEKSFRKLARELRPTELEIASLLNHSGGPVIARAAGASHLPYILIISAGYEIERDHHVSNKDLILGAREVVTIPVAWGQDSQLVELGLYTRADIVLTIVGGYQTRATTFLQFCKQHGKPVVNIHNEWSSFNYNKEENT